MEEPDTTKTPAPKTQENSSKPFPSFLYKAVFVFLLIAVLPIFPSTQSSESTNKTILSRSWELLHLLFVGIAISYGLFSTRNSEAEIEKENHPKSDTEQSYVSRILQVSSVSDDEELESPKGLDLSYETKNYTSNYSQYYPEQPDIMVAEESTKDVKPLLLPVRSLKSRSHHREPVDCGYEVDESLMPNKTNGPGKNGKIGGKESAVLPSPIPWRSRSGKMESPPSPSTSPHQPNSAFDTEVFPSRIQSFQSPTPRSDSPSPNKLSSSTSTNQEIKGKMSEDLVRKKSFKKSMPPPPPPPPPPLKHASHFGLDKRDAMKSFKNELEDRSRREFLQSDNLRSESLRSHKNPTIGRSVRIVGSKEAQNLPPLPRNRSKKRNTSIEDSENEDDYDSEFSDVEEVSNPASVRVAPEPEEVEVSKKANELNHVSQEAAIEENEVDKKADEFIAKFREQIRLQRIASIKKSSGQRIARNAN